MNDINLSGSFIIAGFLLFGLMNMFSVFNTQNSEIIAGKYAATSAAGINELITYDFENIGYRVNDPHKILEISINKIKFLADLGNDGIVDTVLYKSKKVNKNFVITRIVSNPTSCDSSMFIAKQLKITGYDIHKIISVKVGSMHHNNSREEVTYNPDKIGAIGISFVLDYSDMDVESEYKTNFYINKKIYPKNL